MKFFSSLIFGLALCSSVCAAEQKKQSDQIRLRPVGRTPEADNSQLNITFPKNGSTIRGNPVWLQLRVDGYALGTASQFDRADDLPVTSLGQTVHVIIDDQPYFSVNEPAIDPFNEDGYYYDTSYKFKLPSNLSNGPHYIRAFLSRSYGESLKGEKTFSTTMFYLGSSDESSYDLSTPYLTYNEPSDQMYLLENKPVLLDFFLSNCELTPDGYKVRFTIDGKSDRLLTSWQPYYVYGLKKGKHTIRLELIDRGGKVVSGPFNDIERTILIH